jgi:translocation and assembly module TamB
MAAVNTAQRTRKQPRRDLGRAVSVVLCGVFAFVGAVPLGVGLLVRTDFVRSWASRETANLLENELGVHARYHVEVQAWPIAIDLADLVVDAEGGGAPFLEVERVSVRPRLFALLAGQLDVGEVEVLGPRVRIVFEDGEVKNLRYKLPPSSDDPSKAPARAPFSALSVTDARIDATVNGLRVDTKEVDADVSAEDDGAFEIALRAGATNIVRSRPTPGREREEDSVDEDVICRLDARVRVGDGDVLVRRLTMHGSADFDPDPGTSPGCDLLEGDWRSVEIGLGAVKIDLPKPEEGSGPVPNVRGRVHARLPVPLVHRFVDVPRTTGAVGLDVEVDHDGRTTLPRVAGRIWADQPGFGGKVFATKLDADVSIADDVVRVSKVEVGWADGEASIADVKIEPFAPGVPLEAGPIEIRGMQFPGLLRDLDVHPQAHVAWTLEKGRFERFGGTLSPPSLEGPMVIETKNFEVFDKPTTDPARGHMLGVAEGTVRGTFMVKPTGLVLSKMTLETPRSEVHTTVSLRFESFLEVDIFEGSRIDLSELSPLKDLPVAGMAEIQASVRGPFEHPKIEGDVSIEDFEFAGFSVGDVESARVLFEPLDLRVVDAHVRKGDSKIRAPEVHIDFDAGPTVVLDADIDTREAPHLWVHDFYKIFHLDDDPRFAEIDANASGTARVHFVLGGPEDHCGTGRLRVKTHMHIEDAALFGERYDHGEIDVDLDWDDREAGASGMRVDVSSATLHKGTGSLLASVAVRPGGRVSGQAIGTNLPIDRFDAAGAAGKMLDGSVSLLTTIGGTVSQLEANADVSVSPIRIGSATLPSSQLRLVMGPEGSAPVRTLGLTRCGNPRSAPFERAEWDKDLPSGTFRVDGMLAGGQLAFDGVRITRQKHKVVTGKVAAHGLDLGTLANLIPGVAFSSTPPRGKLDAAIDLKRLPLDDLAKADLTVALSGLQLERVGQKVALESASGPIALQNNTLSVPDMRVMVATGAGLSAPLLAGGKVHRVMTAPELDLGLRVGPLDLSRLSADLPQVTRAKGQLDANLRVQGPPSSLRYGGAARLRGGELALRGLPLSLDEIEVDVAVSSSEVRILRGAAKAGGGEISVTGRMPVRGLEFGTAQANLVARGVKVPVSEGLNLTADADLEATFKPGAEFDERGEKALPDIKGRMTLTSFQYTRPIGLSLDLNQLAGKPQRTTVETYDPKQDVLHFDVLVGAPRPLRFTNNLVDMALEVPAPGLNLSGTNQRFGARGMLRISPESKIQLRNSEFTVREGSVRFDDPLRIAPQIDVRAQTEYRRYAASSTAQSVTPDSSGAATVSMGGQWRINLYAHGDQDNLKLDLTSDPPLGQEDIVLLLTIGLTRAEMDRGLASSLGETVGLEALAALTGADKAVKTIVPIIDEFRFGTAYSSRTGRTEPTVTLGKRITDDVRATVTTGITENREIRSSVEWKLGRRMILQGAYDNANDVSSSSLGNLGADLRWRLEFE